MNKLKDIVKEIRRIIKTTPKRNVFKKKRKKIVAKESKKAQSKVKKVMGEFTMGKLHSGSKTGPLVTKPKQAVAIGMSEARKKGMKVPMKKGK